GVEGGVLLVELAVAQAELLHALKALLEVEGAEGVALGAQLEVGALFFLLAGQQGKAQGAAPGPEEAAAGEHGAGHRVPRDGTGAEEGAAVDQGGSHRLLRRGLDDGDWRKAPDRRSQAPPCPALLTAGGAHARGGRRGPA